MPETRYQQAHQKHADGILECLAAAFEPYRADYTPEAFADTTLNKKSVLERMDEMVVTVALHDEKVVGTIAWLALGGDPNDPEDYPPGEDDPIMREGHIRGMAVLPEAQGQGIADTLLKMAEEDLKIDGCTWISLDTTEPLKRAQKFYEKHGFQPSGQVRDFFGMRLIELAKTL